MSAKTDKLLFAFPGYEIIGNNIAKQAGIVLGDVMVRNFPDGESLVQIKSDVSNKKIIIDKDNIIKKD